VPTTYRKSLPHTSTKPQEFQYLSTQPVQQQPQRFTGDGSSQHTPIVVQPMLQQISGGDTEKYMVKCKLTLCIRRFSSFMEIGIFFLFSFKFGIHINQFR
jgi:hypothetical protein